MGTPGRLKIALVGVTHPFRGGISHYNTVLCQALRRDHEVRFLSLKKQYPGLLFPGKTQEDESEKPLQAPNEPCLGPVNPLSWLNTYRRIRAFKPDLVLFSWWHPFFAPAFGTVARLARRFARVPCCFLCHNVLPHEQSLIDRVLLRYAFGSGDAFVCHSEEDRRNLEALVPGATVHLNPHPSYGVFADGPVPATEDAKARLGLAGKRVVLFFGFVREYKGLDHLLAAMRDLPAEEGRHLLVVGEFYDDKRRYQPDLDELTARNQLTLIDRYVPNEEVALYFAAADLVAAPYLSATQSGVIQIAYSFGKPVVATRVGGLPEAVADGVTGYLVPPADAGAIAAAIRECFRSDRREEFAGNIARESEKYSWDRMVDTIVTMARALPPLEQ